MAIGVVEGLDEADRSGYHGARFERAMNIEQREARPLEVFQHAHEEGDIERTILERKEVTVGHKGERWRGLYVDTDPAAARGLYLPAQLPLAGTYFQTYTAGFGTAPDDLVAGLMVSSPSVIPSSPAVGNVRSEKFSRISHLGLPESGALFLERPG
jgi:hypothetical protein